MAAAAMLAALLHQPPGPRTSTAWCSSNCPWPMGHHLAARLSQLSPLQRSVLRARRQGLVAQSHQSESAP